MNLFNRYIDSYPIPDSTINSVISKAAEKNGVKVIFNSYDAGSGIFSITTEASEVEKINRFIADLMEMENFERVDYTGYSAFEDKEGNSGWQIKVVCTLAARNAETTDDNSGEEG